MKTARLFLIACALFAVIAMATGGAQAAEFEA
jgi:hypothetical protein